MNREKRKRIPNLPTGSTGIGAGVENAGKKESTNRFPVSTIPGRQGKINPENFISITADDER